MRRLAAGSFGALLGLLISFAPACDPLYEPAFDGGYKPCCESSRITSCPCVRGESCLFTAQACAGGACVSPDSTLTCAALSPMDSGTVIPGLDGGVLSDAGAPGDAGSPGDGGHMPLVTGYILCCEATSLTSCACLDGVCPSEPFTTCAGGRCAPSGQSCPGA